MDVLVMNEDRLDSVQARPQRSGAPDQTGDRNFSSAKETRYMNDVALKNVEGNVSVSPIDFGRRGGFIILTQ